MEVNSTFSFARTSPARKLPAASVGGRSPALVFSLPPENVRRLAAVAASEP